MISIEPLEDLPVEFERLKPKNVAKRSDAKNKILPTPELSLGDDPLLKKSKMSDSESA